MTPSGAAVSLLGNPMENINPRFRWGAFVGGCLLGVFGLFLNLFVVGSDQMSYLDIARVYLHGSWWTWVNGYWGPLLPALVALAFRLFHPSVAEELPVANGVAYFTYVFFLVAYLFFHAGLVHSLERRFGEQWSPARSAALFLFGFAVALSAAMTVLVQGLLPDLLVAAFFLIGSGWLARFLVTEATWGSVVALALVLALGYLSKSVFFVLALAFIVGFYGAQRSRPRVRAQTFLLAAFFLFFSAVQWLPLSLAKGHFTFGETGKIAYALKIADKHYFEASRMQTGPDGTPLKHPYQVLMDDPLIYGFQGPVMGTYPNWYDDSYWMEGVHVGLHPFRQLTVVFLNTLLMINLLVGGSGLDGPQLPPGLTLGLMVLLGILVQAGRPWKILAHAPWPVLLPALAGLGLYGMTYFTFRYVIGLFIVVMCVCFAEALASFGAERMRAARRISLFLFGITFVVLAGQFLEMLHQDLRHGGWPARFHDSQLDISAALDALNVPPGTRIATVGDFATVYFPDAARVRVLARIEEPDVFWKLPDVGKQQVYARLAVVGLDDLIALAPTPDHSAEGWIPIGASGYILHPLQPASR